MLSAVSTLMRLATRFTHQIIPPVIATLIAAGLIAAYNRAFSGHLQQPRMAAMHAAAGTDDEPATTLSIDKPALARKPVAAYDNLPPPPRLSDKFAKQDAGKDQTAVKLAEPIPALVRAAQALHGEKTEARSEAKVEPRSESRTEPRRLAVIEPAQPVVRTPVAPAAPVALAAPPSGVSAPPTASPAAQEQQRLPVYRAAAPQPQNVQAQYPQAQNLPPLQPPPVVTAQPMVTAPEKPRPTIDAQAETPVPPQGVLGKVVDTLKPSSLLARAREFGEKIEAAGNDILPSIRQ